jgi:hypothetical protein
MDYLSPTPTEYEYEINLIDDTLLFDPVTGRYVVPLYRFDFGMRPFMDDGGPLNRDPRYQKEVIRNIYHRLTEKWLYSDPMYKSLLKYFKVEKKGSDGVVTMITDPDNINKAPGKDTRDHVFKYIEKYIITRRFVEKVLLEYITMTRLRWYDIYSNIDSVKDLLVNKLKKTIIRAIYQAQE